jgi:hypothetical protein
VPEALHSSLADFGIETDPVKYGYKVAYAHKLFQRHRRKCPNAELLIGRLIQIPTFPESAEDILEKVERAWIKVEHCSPSISTAS